ncbi:MAG: hypothetical protein ACWGHH_06725 [Sulfurovaceae bacterium]
MKLEQIEYITALFSLEGNSYVIEDVIEELSDIGFENFKGFYKKNSNYIGSEFKRGFDKFLFFTKLYRKHNIDNTAEIEYYGSLAQKVNYVGNIAIEHNLNYENVKIKDTGKNFFTEKDITTLSRIGTLVQCARLQKSASGTDALLDAMRERIENNHTPLKIANINKEVMLILPKVRAI